MNSGFIFSGRFPPRGRCLIWPAHLVSRLIPLFFLAVMSNIPSRFAAKGGGTRLHSSLVGREECRLFAEGHCQNGSTCRFLHCISIKRPIGFHDCKTNDVARPLRQNYDHTPLYFTVDLEGSSVDTSNTLRLRLQGIQARPQ